MIIYVDNNANVMNICSNINAHKNTEHLLQFISYVICVF